MCYERNQHKKQKKHYITAIDHYGPVQDGYESVLNLAFNRYGIETDPASVVLRRGIPIRRN